MLCKLAGKKYYRVIGSLGLVSLIIGIILSIRIDDTSHGGQMAAGMIAGIGAGLILIFLIRKVREHFSPDKIKQEEVEKNDERNIQVMGAAYTVAGVAVCLYLTVMAVVMAFLDFRLGTYISIGGIYACALTFLISYRIYQKKM